MTRYGWIFFALVGLLLAAANSACAQDARPFLSEGPLMVFALQEPGGGPGLGGPGGPEGPGPFMDRIELLGFGGPHGGKVVKGAPFSAVAISENVQMLADGNKISHTTQTKLYRDSQGRFRKEGMLVAFGPIQEKGKPHSFIFIVDPVANTNFFLEPDEKIARKVPAWKEGPEPGRGPKGDIGYRVEKRLDEANVKTETLSTQTIGGVASEGTRYTETIPAGQMGNERPITIVSERWYSQDLQIVVKSTRSDPRFGTSTYTLTNIQRSEPAASLFVVPADYTVKEGGPGHDGKGRRGPGGPGGEQGPPPPPSN